MIWNTLIPPEWTRDAVCAQTDPEAFFPERGTSADLAKLICNGSHERDIDPCAVRNACLAYALEHHEPYGIWGGLAPRERRGLHESEAA